MSDLMLAVMLGLIPALIAHYKGRKFGLWWAYGTLLFIIAFLHAIFMKDLTKLKICPMCSEEIHKDAKVCKHCKQEV